MESICKSAPPIITNKKDTSAANSLASSSLFANDSNNNNNNHNNNNKFYNVLSGKRSNSNDNKYNLTITSERLAELKKKVEDALREHKTFTIKGGWNTLRRALLCRDWIEKYEYQKPQKVIQLNNGNSLEELCSNLPAKQSWETSSAHKEKCEKMIMSRLLQLHDVDFFWNTRKDQNDWHHRVQTNKIMSRFSRSLFTSKEGLCLLLQQMYWHNETGIANVNFPRCYVLGFPDHFNNFVEDFRLTACMSLMKWFVERFESTTETVHSPEGKVSLSAIKFALNRCDDYIACQKHLDIDRNFSKIWDHEWDQFLSQFYSIVHENELFLQNKEYSLPLLYASIKSTLTEITKYWPQYHLDGYKNIWILKPGNKCRGRGIQLIRNVEDVVKIMNLKLKYVVQKYIEKPLIIYKTKFDIRQWFLLSSTQPLQIWMYRENYLRFSSQIFTLDNFHESLHLTNHAVQCKYTNVNQRDKNLPEENMWDCHTFKNYLKKIGHQDKWDKVIIPGMRECIVGAMLACQDTMDRRPNTFELYGADFILAEDFTPWLLEINSSPDLSSSTSVTAKMCPECLEDIVKVIIDKKRDPKSETGLFELVYKQILPRPPAYLGMSLAIRGRKLFKHNHKGKRAKDKDDEEQLLNPLLTSNSQVNLLNDIKRTTYQGPIIRDLIDDIQKAYFDETDGVDFVPAQKIITANKKKKTNNNNNSKNDRVSKANNNLLNTRKINRKCLSNRRASGNEIIRKIQVPIPICKPRLIKTSYVGIVNEFDVKTKSIITENSSIPTITTTVSTDNWERNTASILRGKNVLCKFSTNSTNNNNNNNNKNDIKTNPRCLNINTTTISNNNNNLAQINKNFLTIGTGFPKKTLKLSNNQ